VVHIDDLVPVHRPARLEVGSRERLSADHVCFCALCKALLREVIDRC
jgi:hypothetical protein